MIYVHNLDAVMMYAMGVFPIRWYGVMYILGMITAWWMANKRVHEYGLSMQRFNDALSYVAFGLIVGGRLGYMLIYDVSTVLKNPLASFAVWQGGMSFHGGLVGGMLALYVYCVRNQQCVYAWMQFCAPLIPPGLGFGRLGNFINAELWGRPTGADWGVVFPSVDALPRHPSQLYEMLGEGVLLFYILSVTHACRNHTALKSRGIDAVTVFLLAYGGIRFVLEYYREPDSHMGFVGFEIWTMGQLLSIAMMVVGAVVLRCRQKMYAVHNSHFRAAGASI